MLTVTLRQGERVRIALPDGRFAWVTFARVVGTHSQRAVLRFEADRDVEIMREELLRRLPPKDAEGC